MSWTLRPSQYRYPSSALLKQCWSFLFRGSEVRVLDCSDRTAFRCRVLGEYLNGKDGVGKNGFVGFFIDFEKDGV